MANEKPPGYEAESTSNLRGLPQPFRFMAYLIDKYFIKMKPWVQVLIILGFFALLMLAGVKALWPELFTPNEESSTLEIRGTITGPNGRSIPDSLWSIELISDELFVRKAAVADRFQYRWLLKAPKEKMDATQEFSFVKYDPDGRKTRQLGAGARFTRVDLYTFAQSSKDGEVHLRLDYFTMELKVDSTVMAGAASTRHSASLLLPFRFDAPIQKRQNSQQKLILSQDSLDAVFREYKTSANPVQQMKMREILVETGTSTMRALADSLKRSVNRNEKGSISDFALALSEYDSLGQLTSAGHYADRFNKQFYERTVELLHTGNEFESRNVATFLRKLQDARAIEPLFNEFSHSQSVRAQRLCIYVLEIFSLNTGAKVRAKVKTWLEQILEQDLSPDVSKAAKEALGRFR